MDTIKEFYRPEDLTRLETKWKRERTAVWVLAGIALALCVLFCCLTNTRNAGQMELAAQITSCLGGWLVIYRRLFGVQAARHELEHARHLLETPHTLLRGRLRITKERLRIKDSIRIRILQLEDGGEIRRLWVNETQVRALRGWDGKRVSLQMAGSYVAGVGEAEGPGQGESAGRSAEIGRVADTLSFLRLFFSQLHRFLLWALISGILWAWVFGLVTDTDAAHKVVLYADVESCEDKALTLRLEEDKPEGIRMIKAHPFSYSMFDDGELMSADLYVVPASRAEQYAQSFAPLDEVGGDWGGRELYGIDGVGFGVKIYDAASGEGAARGYLSYDENQDYYLFFNAASLHLGSGDGAALRVAETLLDLN